MTLLDLLLFACVVGLLVWLVTLLPLPAPFANIVMVIGVVIVVVAALSTLFGINILSHVRGLVR